MTQGHKRGQSRTWLSYFGFFVLRVLKGILGESMQVTVWKSDGNHIGLCTFGVLQVLTDLLLVITSSEQRALKIGR